MRLHREQGEEQCNIMNITFLMVLLEGVVNVFEGHPKTQ